MFLRNLVGVPLAITLVTVATLAWAQSVEHPLPTYERDPTPPKVMPLDKLGGILFEEKGCVACHTTDGTSRVGPTFLHDFGSRIELDTGETITVDEAYLRESIDDPRAKSRPGYPPAMPAEYAKILAPREKTALVVYIKTLR